MTTPATLARFTSGGPSRNSLIIDASSDLYDTTGGGGMGGADTMFESSKGGALTILASFDCAGNNTLLIGNTIVDTAVRETRKKHKLRLTKIQFWNKETKFWCRT